MSNLLKIVVGTRNMEESIAFYVETLGVFEVSIVFMHGPEGPSEVELGLIDGAGSGLLLNMNLDLQPVVMVVTISDWKAIERRLEQASVSYGPVHELPYGIQANISDPFGNHITLFEQFSRGPG